MVPLPSNGPGFDGTPHLKRFVHSSAMPDHVALQMQHQVRQFYIHQGGSHTEGMQEQVSNGSSDMMPMHPKDDRGQNMGSFGTGNMGPSLMRYHSAPGSMLASLIGMGDDLPSQNAELGQCLPREVSALESRRLLHPGDEAYPHSNGVEGELCDAGTGVILDRDVERNGKLMSPHSRFKPPAAVNGNPLMHTEFLSQMSADAKGDCSENATPSLPASLMQVTSIDMLAETGMPPSNLMPKLSARSMLISTKMTSESNGLGHVMPVARSDLFRHSSLPAGFLSHLNDDMSSGNSSDDGVYDMQADAQLHGSYVWDEAGKVNRDSSSVICGARKRVRDHDEKFYASSTTIGTQNGDTFVENVYFPGKLSPDFVTCRTRAKRGCATHPRSIAERVRRNKINERLKKLQDLVPNMDKQTNTVEMLDDAVEYVKYLQGQVQELTESRSKCTCSCTTQGEALSQ